MNWEGQLNKQEESKPQFVDPENQEDEEMERVEKFLGRFKKPQPMPFEEWMKALNGNSGSLDNLVYFIITLDTTDGGPLDLLWEQKRQGRLSLKGQVEALKQFGDDANTIVKNMADRMSIFIAYKSLGGNADAGVNAIKNYFSATLNLRRYAEPLLKQLAQKTEAGPDVKQLREEQQQKQQQNQQPQQQQQPPQAQQQPQGGQ